MQNRKPARFKKTETNVLFLLLYIIMLVFIYEYYAMPNRYSIFSPDEIFYYIEAKAVSSANIYHAPLSLDGNTSFIGDFGSHGISYALLEGWLSKFFFQAADPPIVFINILLGLGTVLLVLIFKPLSLRSRLQIALIICSHYIFFNFTLSYLQETIHFLFAVLALRILYNIYLNKESLPRKLLIQYIILISVATTFRYSWVIWIFGLLPFLKNKHQFFTWIVVTATLLLLAMFIGRYIYAPYPYEEIVAFRILRTEHLSIIQSIKIVAQQFLNNLGTFFSPNVRITTMLMRSLLTIVLLSNLLFAIVGKDKFIVACTIIATLYFTACMGFYFLNYQADERILALLTPIFAFSFVHIGRPIFFYAIIIFQLTLLPFEMSYRKGTYFNFRSDKEVEEMRLASDASINHLKNLIIEDRNVVVSLPVEFIWHQKPNYQIGFPLKTDKGYSIHYKLYATGNDLRKTHPADYSIRFSKSNSDSDQLLYTDGLMFFYKLTH